MSPDPNTSRAIVNVMDRFNPERAAYWIFQALGFRPKVGRVQGVSTYGLLATGVKKGEWVVLIHGISANLTHWRKVAWDLKQAGYRVFLPDLVGHGHSQDASGLMTFERLRELTNQQIASVLKGERAHVVGNSLGGALALSFAADHPELTQSLALISPAGGIEDPGTWHRLQETLRLGSHAKTMEFLYRVDPRRPLAYHLIAPYVRRSFARPNVRDLIESTTVESFEAAADVEKVKAPCLLFWGKKELLFESTQRDWLMKKLPSGTRLVEPETAGHCPMFDQPEVVTQALLPFFRVNALPKEKKK